jgi:hypothetical protein
MSPRTCDLVELEADGVDPLKLGWLTSLLLSPIMNINIFFLFFSEDWK